MLELTNSQTESTRRQDKFVWFGIVFCLIGSIVAYLLWRDSRSREEGAIVQAGAKAALVSELEKLATDKLPDPDSAKFRSLVLYHDPKSSSLSDKYFGEYRLCGELNAKNYFGGYVGYNSFISEMYIGTQGSKIVHTASGTFLKDSESSSDHFFSDLEKKDCVGLGEQVEP